jgi:hypothetical protein
MIYSRYLDIHLCTNTDLAAVEAKQRAKTPTTYQHKFFGGAHPYFYEFNNSLLQQMRYREAKDEGFTFNANNQGNCKVLSDVELTHSVDSYLTNPSSSSLDSATGEVTYALNAELKQIRYVGCMVAIEHLKTTVIYPQLHQLMVWISDEETVNKLRINCHGSGTKTGGMSMGNAVLSPDELIKALTRHGLKRRRVHTGLLTGLAHAADTYQSAGARWRDDSESNRCQNKDCNKPFKGIFTTGKHHCRRCGGLFCEECSSNKANLAVALTGKNTTAKNVTNARVCKKCYAQVKDHGNLAVSQRQIDTNQTNYGLKTICLACCMGAKSDDNFSPEREHNPAGPQLANTTFVVDSLAARLLIALRGKQLTGIKVTASNQVLADYGQKGIAAQCGITVPSEKGQAGNLRDAAKQYSFVGGGNQSVRFPAYIWGNRQSLKAKYDQLNIHPLAFAGFQKDVIVGNITVAGRRLFFGEAEFGELMTLYNEFLSVWTFTSWAMRQTALVAQPGGNPTGYTWALTPPPRVTQLSLIPGAVTASGSNSIAVSVRSDALESFKHYKSYEVS